MNADERDSLNQLARRVIGAAYEVSNVLGAGFLEKVYHHALCHELQVQGIAYSSETKLSVRYKGIVVGDYMADLIIEDKLIVELKCAEALAERHVAQCLNYLRATGGSLALLINFQNPKVEIRRVVLNF
jgi:GxxExxY protein